MAQTLNTAIPILDDYVASQQSQYSNSYVDVAYADSFFTGHYDVSKSQSWLALNTDQKTSLLIAACRVIETVKCVQPYNLRQTSSFHLDRRTGVFIQAWDDITPTKYSYFQRLQFPRNLDRDIMTGMLYVPEFVMNAQCEQAVYLLTLDQTALANRNMGIVRDMTYVGNIHLRQDYVQDGSSLAPMALESLRPYILKGRQVRR